MLAFTDVMNITEPMHNLIGTFVVYLLTLLQFICQYCSTENDEILD
jgi:hypothetical protein